jgi:hypothetical protein
VANRKPKVKPDLNYLIFTDAMIVDGSEVKARERE